MAADLILVILPMVIFFHLDLPLSRRIGLWMLLGTGVITAVIAGLKVWQLRVLVNADDLTYNLSTALILNWTEMWATLILSSLAPLWPFLKSKYSPMKYFLCTSKGRHQRIRDPINLTSFQNRAPVEAHTSTHTGYGRNSPVYVFDQARMRDGTVYMFRTVTITASPNERRQLM
ncbi:MAG: hypothetical protein Q9162_005458 [Coniocarpon cinnabarinum]